MIHFHLFYFYSYITSITTLVNGEGFETVIVPDNLDDLLNDNFDFDDIDNFDIDNETHFISENNIEESNNPENQNSEDMDQSINIGTEIKNILGESEISESVSDFIDNFDVDDFILPMESIKVPPVKNLLKNLSSSADIQNSFNLQNNDEIGSAEESGSESSESNEKILLSRKKNKNQIQKEAETDNDDDSTSDSDNSDPGSEDAGGTDDGDLGVERLRRLQTVRWNAERDEIEFVNSMHIGNMLWNLNIQDGATFPFMHSFNDITAISFNITFIGLLFAVQFLIIVLASIILNYTDFSKEINQTVTVPDLIEEPEPEYDQDVVRERKKILKAPPEKN